MILCIGPTPALQRVMVVQKVKLDSVNRAAVTIDGTGGKSINVAKVLKALGEKPLAVGFAGGNRGDLLTRAVEKAGIRNDFIRVPAETRQCITVIDQRHGTQTELVEESKPVPEPFYKSLLTRIKQRMAGCRAIVISGTLTPGAPEKFYLECARAARAAGAIVVLDAKGAPLMNALGAQPDVVKPNRAELEGTAGKRLEGERELKGAIRALAERGAKNIVITAGSRPAVAFDRKDFWRITSVRVKALNPIGSGDAFTAGLVWRLLKGDSFAEACRFGAACGAANALTLMCGEIDPALVKGVAARVQVEKLRP